MDLRIEWSSGLVLMACFGIYRMDCCFDKELTGFGLHVKDFNHYSISAKWIQESSRDTYETLVKLT